MGTFKNLTKYLILSMMAVIIASSAASAHIITGRVQTQVDYTPSYFRLWDISRTYSIGTGDTSYDQLIDETWHTHGADGVNNDLDNLDLVPGNSPHQLGDIVVMVLDKELYGGTSTHEGWYAVSDITLDTEELPTLYWSDVRQIPQPVAFLTNGGTKVYVFWNPAVDSGSNNILGYYLYKSPNGTTGWTQVNGLITGTSTEDSTVNLGYYYAIKIVYRGGSSGDPEIESTYLSKNSNPVQADTTDPVLSYVNDGATVGVDIDSQTDKTSISGNWRFTHPLGILRYEYAVGTTSGGQDVIGRTNAGIAETFTASATLENGVKYYLTVWATSNGGRTAEASSDGFIVGILPPSGQAHNYPNPFDPRREETKIVVDIPEQMNVGTYIYDITARLVWKDVRNLPAGIREIPWNGINSFGEISYNGVYLVRIVNEDSKKLIAKGKILVIKR